MTEELKKEFSKLRFLDENGELYPEWEEKKLGEIGETFNGLTGKSGSDFSETKTEGMQPYVSYVDVYSQNRVPLPSNYVKINENEKNNPVKKNDIFFTTSSETKEETGLASLMAYEPTEKTYLNSFCFGFRTCVEGNSLYLMNTMRYGNLRKKINVLAQGSTRYNISKTKLMKETINLPSLPEQEKIANFLSKIDEKIKAQAKLVELLKKQKQGYSQKIFNGSLRFKKDDGTDYDDWEEKKLGEVSECLDNKRKPLNGIERRSISGNIPYYGSTSIQGYVNDYIFDEELVLLGEDAAPFYEFREKPIAQYVNEKCWVNNHVHVLRAKENTRFLFYSLVHKDVRKFVSSKTRGKLNQSDMVKILIPLPSLPEQEKIAAFLSNLDNRIDEELNKLEKLKLEKNGYMQRVLG